MRTVRPKQVEKKTNRDTLAINGGKPVRTKPFPPPFIGANLIGREEKALVDKVMDAKSLFRHYGANCLHMVDQFETELADAVGARYALATSSGSGALFCAMKGLNVGPGDEVILPGGALDRLLARYDNLYLDLSAGSGFNAVNRDPEFTRGFIARHWRKMLWGSDCCGIGQAIPQIPWLAKLEVAPDVKEAIADGNARTLLGLPPKRDLSIYHPFPSRAFEDGKGNNKSS